MSERVIRDDGLYADEVAAIVAGADQRRNGPRIVDDIETLRAKLADARATYDAVGLDTDLHLVGAGSELEGPVGRLLLPLRAQIRVLGEPLHVADQPRARLREGGALHGVLTRCTAPRWWGRRRSGT